MNTSEEFSILDSTVSFTWLSGGLIVQLCCRQAAVLAPQTAPTTQNQGSVKFLLWEQSCTDDSFDFECCHLQFHLHTARQMYCGTVWMQ